MFLGSFFRAYELLSTAADLGHAAAMEKVAMAYLFGDHLKQNLTRARAIFERLALRGSPRGQLVRSMSNIFRDNFFTFVS